MLFYLGLQAYMYLAPSRRDSRDVEWSIADVLARKRSRGVAASPQNARKRSRIGVK